MESAARSAAEISSDLAINTMGKHFLQALKKSKKVQQSEEKEIIKCYNCDDQILGSIAKHKSKCTKMNPKCKKCGKIGYLAHVWRSSKDIQQLEDKVLTENNGKQYGDESYQISVFCIKTYGSIKPKLWSLLNNRNNFKVHTVIHDTFTAETGAHVSVCGTTKAKKWGTRNSWGLSGKKTNCLLVIAL